MPDIAAADLKDYLDSPKGGPLQAPRFANPGTNPLSAQAERVPFLGEGRRPSDERIIRTEDSAEERMMRRGEKMTPGSADGTRRVSDERLFRKYRLEEGLITVPSDERAKIAEERSKRGAGGAEERPMVRRVSSEDTGESKHIHLRERYHEGTVDFDPFLDELSDFAIRSACLTTLFSRVALIDPASQHPLTND
eukprot:2970693-Rhodomonas_salina.1